MRNLQLLPLDKQRRWTQKCYLGPDKMKELNLTLGSNVVVKTKSCDTLCTVWPQADLCEGYIQYDTTVTAGLTPRPHHKGSKIEDFQSIPKAKTLDKLSISVILKDHKLVFQYKAPSQHRRLVKYVRNCLAGFRTLEKCCIDLSGHPLGELYSISYIICESEELDVETVGVISNLTEFDINKLESLARFEQRSKQKGNWTLGGLKKPAQLLEELIKLPLLHKEELQKLGTECPRGILLRGPPGCGKTSLVRHVAGNCDAYVLAVDGPSILGARPGESEENLVELFKEAREISQEGPCILFFDEIDSLCPARSKGSTTQESRVVGQLVTLLDQINQSENLVIVGATNRPNAIDPSLRRPGRFDREIFIGVPTLTQRLEILQLNTDRIELVDVDLDDIAKATNGYVGADLVSLCRDVMSRGVRKLLQGGLTNKVPQATMSDFKDSLCEIVPSTQKGSDVLADYRPIYWHEIGGLEDIKLQIKQAVEWPIKHPDAFIRMGIPSPKGILLYGPPGCCKTTLVRAAATSCGATFLSVSSGQLYSPYVGDSERIITEVFQQARAGSPSIIFFDEIDAIVGKRSDGGSSRGVQERVLSTLLNQMDGVGLKFSEKSRTTKKDLLEGDGPNQSEPEGDITTVDNGGVIVVAATNRPDMLDDAFVRPGRIDRLIFVPPPDEMTRLKILEIHTRKMPVDGVDIAEIAKKTEGYTGADLENLCREAALHALTIDGITAASVTSQHFQSALVNSKRSLTREVLDMYSILSKGLTKSE